MSEENKKLNLAEKGEHNNYGPELTVLRNVQESNRYYRVVGTDFTTETVKQGPLKDLANRIGNAFEKLRNAAKNFFGKGEGEGMSM